MAVPVVIRRAGKYILIKLISAVMKPGVPNTALSVRFLGVYGDGLDPQVM